MSAVPSDIAVQVGDWRIDTTQVLGQGAFGMVFAGQNVVNGQTAAVKMVSCQGADTGRLSRLASEVDVQQKCRSPYVLSLYGVYRSDRHLYLVTERCSCDLKTLQEKNGGRFGEATARYLMRQLALGLRYLHDKKIVHRDIKPANVLVTLRDAQRYDADTARLKIADLGFARFLDESVDPCTHSILGAPGFMAPEIWISGRYNSKADVYSLGVVLFVLLWGRVPYHVPADLMAHIHRRDQFAPVPLPDELTAQLSQPCVDFLRALLAKNPALRPNCFELCAHAWLGLTDADFMTPLEAQFNEPPAAEPPPPPPAASQPATDALLHEALSRIGRSLSTLAAITGSGSLDSAEHVDQLCSRVDALCNQYVLCTEENKRLAARLRQSVVCQDITAGDQVLFLGVADQPFTYRAWRPVIPVYLAVENLSDAGVQALIHAGRPVAGLVVELRDHQALPNNPYDLPSGALYRTAVIAQE